MAIKTSWDVREGVLSIRVQEGADGEKGAPFSPTGREFTREFDLNEHGYKGLTELGQAGLEFGFFTRLRNATAGKSLDEAEAAMDAVLDAFAEGEWAAERGASAAPFTVNAPLVKAIVRASKGAMEADDVAGKVNARAEATATANFKAAFADLDDKARGKVRRAVTEWYVSKQPAIARAMAEIEREQAEKRAAKKLAALAGKGEGEIEV